MEQMIKIIDLHKSFGEVHAVNGLNFEIRKKELFAFLGVNGAGKSTTISMICGQLEQDNGEITICGMKLNENRNDILRKIGVVYQSSVLDGPLTVMDNLKCRGALYGLKGEELKKRIAELAELLDFKDLMNRTVSKLSGGQRRRIDIARALIHKPEILILDEPTTGLDPQTRKLLWNVINDLRMKDELTVLLTTHYMEEAAEADYCVIIDAGSICAEGTPLDLKNKYAKDYINFYNVELAEVEKLNLEFMQIKDGYRVVVDDVEDAVDLINKHKDLFKDFEITKGKMDDVFLAVTGKKLEGGSK